MPFQAVHIPIDAPEEYKRLYADMKFDDEAKADAVRRFGGFVSQMDAKVGEFIAALEATGQRDNTLVVFTSDNGGTPALGNPYAGKTPPLLVGGAVIALGLYLLRVPSPIAWGVMFWLLNYIPYVGFWLALIPPAILAAVTLGSPYGLMVVILYFVVNNVIKVILLPKVMGDKVDTSMTLGLLGIFFWGVVLGVFGMLLAYPYTLLVRVGPGGRGSTVSVHGQLTTSAGDAGSGDPRLREIGIELQRRGDRIVGHKESGILRRAAI